MKKIWLSTVTLALITMLAAPAFACGMYVRPMYWKQKDTSHQLLVQAERLEKSQQPRAALRIYERVMYYRHAKRSRRAQAALAAYRLRLDAGDSVHALARLRLAVKLDPKNDEARQALAAWRTETTGPIAQVTLDSRGAGVRQ